MPANFPPMYFAAEQRFRDARTIEAEIEALEEMLAIMPKHKGTDKLKADLRRKIARLKGEASRKRAPPGGKAYSDREGGGGPGGGDRASECREIVAGGSLTNASP